MGTLFLLRHAKAVKAPAGMKDFERPLEPSGRADARRLGEAMGEALLAVDRVLCSASARTRETLDSLGLPFEAERILFSQNLYEADAAGYLRLLGAETGGSALLIGHNPACEELASMLSGTGEAEAMSRVAAGFPTAGLAVIDFEGAIAPRSGHLRRFRVPDRS